MKDIDVQAIWEKYALLEGVPECKGYRVTKDGVKIPCGEDDPNMFEPGRLNYCKRCRARQEQDRRAIRKAHPPPEPGICPICKQPTDTWNADHDHAEGADGFRGYICGSCNVGIGKMGDDPETLRRAAAHVERSRSKRQ